MVASHLLRKASRPLRVVLIDRLGRFGQGLAYGTPDPNHLLNVSAGAMSAWAEDPSHLLRWLDLNRDALAHHLSAAIDAGFFLPRHIYGLYLQSILEEAQTLATGQTTLQCLKAELVDLEPLQPSHPSALSMGGGYRLLFQGRDPLVAHRVVLAWGNSPSPPQMALNGCERHGWAPNATSDLDPEASVFLLGTGLTMVDMVVSLVRQGHRGPLVALSRRGFRPLPHRIAAPIGPWLDPERAPSTVLDLWRLIRQRVKQAQESSEDWRPVIDGLRPLTQQLWRLLNQKERERFLRHAAVVWDVHRHRISPQLHQHLQDLLHSGQLQYVSGRLQDVKSEGKRLTIVFWRRGGPCAETLVVDRLIRCTGMPRHERASSPPLLCRLQSRGLLQPDPLGLGLQASEGGALLNAVGEVVPWLYTLGTPLRGQLWESIAVPELRQQAQHLAQGLLQSLPPHLRGLSPLAKVPLELLGPSSPRTDQPLLFRQLFDPKTSTFTYLLADPRTGDAALVDPVLGYEDRDLQLLQELKLSLRFCLETHLHADHITAAGQLRRRTGCRLLVPAAPGISNADQLLSGGDRLQLGGIWIEVIATPGHTPEHVAYRIGDSHLLSGDSLLIRGCGRTDFQNGNPSDLYDSLQQLLKLPDQMLVYPGHDGKGRCQSTIREERENNPRLVGRSRADFTQLMNNLRLAPPEQIAKALPANLYLGDLLPDVGHQSEREQHQRERNDAEKIEAANKEIINDFIGMFI
jgi:uncharacterized NAD(P)/FAD-binding protein YdhS/glyoxylase-like metal-dependent hydrolase (beta-lactamase superfamily II)